MCPRDLAVSALKVDIQEKNKKQRKKFGQLNCYEF